MPTNQAPTLQDGSVGEVGVSCDAATRNTFSRVESNGRCKPRTGGFYWGSSGDSIRLKRYGLRDRIKAV